MKNKIALILFIIIVWEAFIFFLATHVSNMDTIKYQIAARYSARTSFATIAIILLWLGISGLRRIYSREDRRVMFMLLLLAFAVNHLIHFVYIVLNYQANELNLFNIKNGFGAIGYVMLSAAPFYLWHKRKLSRSLYVQIYVFLFIIITIFSVTYLGRLSKPVTLSSPVIVYDLCLAFIALVFILNAYRVLKESRATIVND